MINSKILSKLWDLIPASQKKRTPLLMVLIFCGMLFEVFGLGALFPIVIGLLDVDEVREFIAQHLDFLVPYVQSFSDAMFIYVGLGCLIILYILKSAFLVYLSYFQNDYLTKVSRDNSNRLYAGYLNQSYAYFIEKNTSNIIKLFQVEINYLLSYLSALSFVLTELSMSLAIVLTLLVIEPLGALMVAVFFGVMSLLFYSTFKTRLASYGNQREKYDGNISKNILESFQAIKEIKINQRGHYFKSIHQENNLQRARITRNQLIVGQLPRLFLEVIAVTGLTIFIVVLLMQGLETKKLISILTVFVAASFRMIPSLNRVLNGVQSMRFLQASIDTLHKEFTSFNSTVVPEVTTHEKNQVIKKNIQFKDLSFAYTNKKTNVLKGLNLNIAVGSSIGIIGGSGEGKTTLLDVLIGLLEPTRGNLFIDGHEITHNNRVQWQKNIGYVAQMINLVDNSIKKNIAFGIPENEINHEKLNRCIEKAQLKTFIASLEDGVETVVGERGIQLSGGQRQRIGIARALYHDPEVLVFDEATSALDEDTEEQFMSAIERFKGEKTIIIVTHRLSTLRFCDRVYDLKNGKLSPHKTLTNELH